MKKLKTILQSKWFYLFLGVIIFLDVIIFTKCIKYESVYEDGSRTIEGTVESYQVKEDKILLELKAREKIKGTYYITDNSAINISIGDRIEIKGEFSTPLENTVPNTFNYKKYLYQNKIYKIVSIKEIKSISNSKNIFVKLKNYIYKRASVNEYLLLFICGDKSGLDNLSYNSYKNIGIAHLLAISGMHVSIFILILNKILFLISDNKRKILIISFLIFYSYVVGFSPSILRVVIFYIIGYILKRINIKISNLSKLILTAFIIIIMNPFNIYSVSFQYSFLASLAIILTSKYQSKKYFKNILIISFWTLLFSLPITVGMNYEINLISFLSNLLFIPYVSFFLYPLALICFILPFFLPILSFFISIMENISAFLSNINFLVINVPKLNIIFILLFYFFLIFYVYYHKKRFLLLIVCLLLLNKLIPKFDKNDYVIFFDVGQGDCSALISAHQKDVILIDTGGIANYQVSDNVILYLKSKGITRISTIVLTHGDSDHAGDTFNIVEKMKVKGIMLNKGMNNSLEKRIINLNIPIVKEFYFKNKKYQNLNKEDFGNENDNSIVLNINISKLNFLLMGDASTKTEEYIKEKADVIKIGHHGSKTSSKKDFLLYTQAKVAIISSGRNNRFNHPSKEVMDRLNNLKIECYNTQNHGTIIFKISKTGYNILTMLA